MEAPAGITAAFLNGIVRYRAYHNGKTAAMKAILGQAMAKTSGRGNAVLINRLVEEALNRAE